MKKIDDIAELNFNDSILLRSVVKIDSVEMVLDYIDCYESQESSIRHVIFRDCSKVIFTINPGYEEPNSLLDAYESPLEELRQVTVETSTTAGTIEIICKEILFGDGEPAE